MDKPIRELICPNCNNREFLRVEYIVVRILDNRGQGIVDSPSTYPEDAGIGRISYMCRQCHKDINPRELKEGIEVETF